MDHNGNLFNIRKSFKGMPQCTPQTLVLIYNALLFLFFRIFTKDYCIQLGKPQLDANRPKSPCPPPPHFCLLVRYSAHIVAHDVTSRTNISCIIEPHIGCDLVEKPPPPQYEGKFLTPAGWKVPTFSYFSGFFLLFPTLGSNSYFFLLFHIFQFSFKGSTWLVVGC